VQFFCFVIFFFISALWLCAAARARVRFYLFCVFKKKKKKRSSAFCLALVCCGCSAVFCVLYSHLTFIASTFHFNASTNLPTTKSMRTSSFVIRKLLSVHSQKYLITFFYVYIFFPFFCTFAVNLYLFQIQIFYPKNNLSRFRLRSLSLSLPQ
jgi:hypothetical protein